MKALDAAAGRVADTCDAGPVDGTVRGVDSLDYRSAHRFSCLPDAAGRLHARDGGDQARAGNPEARRHLAHTLVLDNARQAERTTGCDSERAWPTSELPCDGGVVSRCFRHQVLISVASAVGRNPAVDGSVFIEQGYSSYAFLTPETYSEGIM